MHFTEGEQFDHEIPVGEQYPPDYTPSAYIQDCVMGRTYRSWDGKDFKAVAFNPRYGLWVCQRAPAEGEKPELRNISIRALDRTFHEVREISLLNQQA